MLKNMQVSGSVFEDPKEEARVPEYFACLGVSDFNMHVSGKESH